MYEVERHDSARAFLERAEPWLLTSEARHNLILGLSYGAASRGQEAGQALYATVEADGDVVGCVVRTPPYKLLVTDAPTEAAEEIVRVVSSAYDRVPAVLGPPRVAEAIAEAWVARNGGAWRRGMEQRIYRLDRVVRPERTPGGRMRPAGPDDLALAASWGEGFARDTGQHFPAPVETVRGWTERGLLWVWDDDGAKSIAVAHGITPRGVRIGYVYTPPEARGRGYASVLVAELSQRMLDEGRDFCVLYTDLSNPTSNAIYQRIGYQPIEDVRDIDIVGAVG